METTDLKVWEELPIDLNARLTADVRSRYIKIIEDEFNNQSTMYHNQINEMKEHLVEKHKKKVGFDKLVDEIAEAQAKLEHAKRKLARTGLTENGDLIGVYGYTGDAEGREASRKVQADIDKLTASIKAPTTFKNKIMTLMLSATKVGQAQFIMRQVLGNGVLKEVDVKALTFEA